MSRNDEHPVYRIAGQSISFDRQIDHLRTFYLNEISCSFCPDKKVVAEWDKYTSTNTHSSGINFIRVIGRVDNHLTTFIARWTDTGVILDISIAGRFWTSSDGCSVCMVSNINSSKPDILEEAQLGAPLILALALNNVWCLHASAVEYKNKAIAFLGESGKGKSTLAEFFKKQPEGRLIADDILPVSLENGTLYCLPHFPQLKLALDHQPGSDFPERLHLSAIYLLEEHETITVNRLSPSRAAVALLSQTAASRLFDQNLLSRHFSVCNQTALDTPIYALGCPRRHEDLPYVLYEIENEMPSMDFF